MGAASSYPRTVTLDINSPVGVIDISDDVVKRLKSGMPSKEGKHSASQGTTGGPDVPSSYPNAVPPAAAIFHGEPSLTSLQVLQQKEHELRENDIYWSGRLKNLESNMKETNEILEKEYSNSVADVKKRFAVSAVTQQLPPCQDLKAKVIECYGKNQHSTLNCSSEVQAFTDCVNVHRIALLKEKASDSKGAKK